jgi:tRNA G18 (ribose-2'-O)-methylase SpoU
LKKDGYIICSIEQVNGSVSLTDFNIEDNKKYAVIFGNEVKGVDQKVVDASNYCIEISQYGTKHSLNVSISAGIVIWEFHKKLKK